VFDPNLAFSPESYQCNSKVYRSIDDFVKAEGQRCPEFIIGNRNDDRKTQNLYIKVDPDGQTTCFERFWISLRAPDLNLKKDPFDTQKFNIKLDSVRPKDHYILTDGGNSQASTSLGNLEWDIKKLYTNIIKFSAWGMGTENSRFSLDFIVKRHIDYYIFRILIPILLIIIMSYLSFFLHRNYIKRIEIVSANLLLFMAYNFTIDSELPKLGYLTFLDLVNHYIHNYGRDSCI
jgi:hypothetical protein